MKCLAIYAGALLLASIACVKAPGPNGVASAKARLRPRLPNIVLIMADDQGWGDLSLHGNTNLSTPHIDSLARDGTMLSRFFVSPICAPTRASLLTGRYHLRTGVRGVSRGRERMNLDEVTFADIFRAAGYATGCFGKWHNGSQYPYHPNGRGFQEYYGFCCGHWGHYFDPLLEHNGEEVRGKGFIADDLTDKAIAFIAANRDRPFLCYIPYNTPHSPFQVPDRNYDKFKDFTPTMRHRDPRKEELGKTRAALALCENIDENVGRVLQKLDELSLRERTIVIYLSDNGPNSWRWNGGMKGRKGSVDEGGVRVPFLIRWPGKIAAGGRIDRIAAHIDILPTLVALTGVPMLKTKPLDGVSLTPLLLGDRTGTEWPDRKIFSVQGNRTSVRTQRYRADKRVLFDMTNDPGQRSNIARQKPEVHRRLAAAIRKFRAEVGTTSQGARPFPVGHPAFPLTVLPAQDCRFSGKGLRFSSRHPNASWITNWTSAQVHPYWDIEVATTGTYEVTLLYTCPARDVGATIEVGFNGSTLRGTVSEAFDPPLIEANDRVKRGESYDKPFKPLVLGRLELQKGRGELHVKALGLSALGKTVMDLRSVKLRLLARE